MQPAKNRGLILQPDRWLGMCATMAVPLGTGSNLPYHRPGDAENGQQRPLDGRALISRSSIAVGYRFPYQPQQQEMAQRLHRDQVPALAAPWFGPLMT